MRVMAFEGVIKNGRVELPPGVSLPDRAKVYIVIPEVVEVDTPQSPRIYSPRLANPADAVHFTKMEVTKEEPNAGP